MNHARLFAFESDFVDTLHCVPMAVRLKLDRCAIKLSLRQWNRFSPPDREELLRTPCQSPLEVEAYRARLCALIRLRAGEEPKALPPEAVVTPPSSDAVPEQVASFASAMGVAPPPVSKWSALDELERFVLMKLSRDNHDNVNFVPALREFGVVG